jgi:hypothetical protein
LHHRVLREPVIGVKHTDSDHRQALGISTS